MKTLQRIHQKKRYDVTGQDAVWSHTDNADISGDKEAQDLAGGSSVPDEKAAADGSSVPGKKTAAADQVGPTIRHLTGPM